MIENEERFSLGSSVLLGRFPPLHTILASLNPTRSHCFQCPTHPHYQNPLDGFTAVPERDIAPWRAFLEQLHPICVDKSSSTLERFPENSSSPAFPASLCHPTEHSEGCLIRLDYYLFVTLIFGCP